MKPYRLAVIIGRYQIPHLGHEAMLAHAGTLADERMLMLGSAYEPRTLRNPFLITERRDMIRTFIPDDLILSVRDYTYRDHLWFANVKRQVNGIALDMGITDPKQIVIVGCDKDHTTFYLNYFPEYSLSLCADSGINSTKCRNLFWQDWPLVDYVNPKVQAMLTEWKQAHSDEFQKLVDKYWGVKRYREEYGEGPFLTADAILTWEDEIALGTRKDGTLAMFGGFLNPQETFETGARRELSEEGNYEIDRFHAPVYSETFDALNRDPRAHIITKAHHWKFDKKPQISAGDDIIFTAWVKKNSLDSRLFYADHYHIIQKVLEHDA